MNRYARIGSRVVYMVTNSSHQTALEGGSTHGFTGEASPTHMTSPECDGVGPVVPSHTQQRTEMQEHGVDLRQHAEGEVPQAQIMRQRDVTANQQQGMVDHKIRRLASHTDLKRGARLVTGHSGWAVGMHAHTRSMSHVSYAQYPFEIAMARNGRDDVGTCIHDMVTTHNPVQQHHVPHGP